MEKYINFDNSIIMDYYEIESIIHNREGLCIVLSGDNNTLDIRFGAVGSYCITDEGNRIESYNLIDEIQNFRKNDFFCNPLYSVSKNSRFLNWLNQESCGFSENLEHYCIITMNSIVDIASAFPPKIFKKKK